VITMTDTERNAILAEDIRLRLHMRDVLRELLSVTPNAHAHLKLARALRVTLDGLRRAVLADMKAGRLPPPSGRALRLVATKKAAPRRRGDRS
jgi:hypothetical protein